MRHEPECKHAATETIGGLPCRDCDVARAGYQRGRVDAAKSLEACLAMMYVNCDDIPDNTTVQAFRKYADVLIASVRGPIAGLDPMLGDGAMLQAALQAVQEFVEVEPGDERFTCLDGTHEAACTCGASDPDDARDAARERAWDGDQA